MGKVFRFKLHWRQKPENIKRAPEFAESRIGVGTVFQQELSDPRVRGECAHM